MTLQPTPLKRIVIKEELWKLTGDHYKAIILNQFVYWSERVQDFDRFIHEERERMLQEGQNLNMSPTNGWIYKSAEELIEETMLDISPATLGRHIQYLVEKEYLLWRHNPDHKWDRTKQYRVNFVKLMMDLLDLGYTLDGYAFFNLKDASFTVKNGDFNLKNGDFNLKDQTLKNERAIPEITTEITNKNKSKNNNAHARANYIDITVENQEAEEKDFSTSTLFSDMPTSSSSSPSNTMKDYDWDKNENPETTASLEMNQEPIYTMNGQAALEPVWEEILNPKEPNHTDFHSQVVEPACQAFEQKIMIYLGRPFVVREEDYRKLVSLLASGVPKTFILESIDHAFDQFELYHPGKKLRAPAAYCLAVIESQWELELAKRSEPTLISFETKANNGDQATTHQRSRTSYRSNDVHLSINSPKPKDPRYPAFYELFPDG